MRRPLLLICLCLVVLLAFGYYFGDSPGEEELPDGQKVMVTGRICQKDDNSFYLIIQTIAASSRQENPQKYQYFNRHRCKVVCEIADNKAGGGTGKEAGGEAGKKTGKEAGGGTGKEAGGEAGKKTGKEAVREAGKEIGREVAGEAGGETVLLGRIVKLQGSFEVFSKAGNPGEFDYRKYSRSLGLTGRVKDVEILEYSEKYSLVREFLYRLKCYWETRLYRIFPEKEASVMTAVLLGDKSNLDREIKDLYQSNGMLHILSISGLHITVIGMGLYRLLRRLGMPVWPAAVCGGVVLVLYGIMTGLSVSACRAIGMYLLRMFSHLCGRTYDMLNALGVMAVFVVLRNPGCLENMGFWLSFGSILGVGILYPTLAPAKDELKPRTKRYVEERWKRTLATEGKKLLKTIEQGFGAGLSITLTTLPIQLWFLYEIPVYSVLLNILVLPFMGLVMTAGLAAMLVPGLGFVGTADVLILAGYEKLCLVFNRLPFHTWNPGRPKIWQVVVYYLLWFAVVCGTLWYREERKKENHAVLRTSPNAVFAGKIMILTISVIVIGLHIPRGDRVTFLDVGQGDCICVQMSTGDVYLFDCGSSSRTKIGERVLIPFLKYYGISHIDGIFLSHPDEDHMNGLRELFALGEEEHITVDQVILPAALLAGGEDVWREVLQMIGEASQKKPVEIGYVKAGDELWEYGGRERTGGSEIKSAGAVSRINGDVTGKLGDAPQTGGEAAGKPGDASQTGGDVAEKPGDAPRKPRFLCVHPPAGFSLQDTNACSECFYMEFGDGFSLLLTGDADGAGEQAMLDELRRLKIGQVTVLKVAHHGSKGATSEELLHQISPVLSVISCGKRNPYGHPHAELLERLEQAGSGVLRTDECGAISLEIRRGKVVVRQFCE